MASKATKPSTEETFGPSVPFGHPDWRPPAVKRTNSSKSESRSVKTSSDTEASNPKPHSNRRRSSSFTHPPPTPLNVEAINQALVKANLKKVSPGSINMFPSFLDSSAGSGALPRQAPSPIAQQHQGIQQQQQQGNTGGGMNGMNGMNGMGGMGVGLPMNAGHQMDLNVLYNQMEDLSVILKENRDKTQAIIASAEELATRAAASGSNPTLQQANNEIMAARIADLQRQLSSANATVNNLRYERREDFKLIKELETGLSHITELVRNYAYTRETELLKVRKHYNGLLQIERDAHLASRLEGLGWQEKFIDSVQRIRQAYRLRCDEEDVPICVVAGLQNEVRAYRNALGMEPEKFEHEYGYEILKDVPGGAE